MMIIIKIEVSYDTIKVIEIFDFLLFFLSLLTILSLSLSLSHHHSPFNNIFYP